MWGLHAQVEAARRLENQLADRIARDQHLKQIAQQLAINYRNGILVNQKPAPGTPSITEIVRTLRLHNLC